MIDHADRVRADSPAAPSNPTGASRGSRGSRSPWPHRDRGLAPHLRDEAAREPLLAGDDLRDALDATGFKATLPFLDPTLLSSADGVPLRVAGMTLPVGLERLYFVGLAAPRGPQLPVYSAQARLIAKFLTAQERTPIPLSAVLARSSRPESRIDIPRHE
jgi:hypothetical protein